MTLRRADILATRVINQYRGTDIIPYLSLRYCFENTAARSREWIEDIATSLASHAVGFPYYKVAHFKEMKGKSPERRQIHVPTAAQAISESFLLHQCALSPQAFANPDCVYSYTLSSGDSRQGVFEHYTIGLKRRHQDVAKACRKYPGGVVCYRDVKNFYPSVVIGKAHYAWDRHAIEGGLDDRYVKLGHSLLNSQCISSGLSGHSAVYQGGQLLVGPMISHLIGNLLFRDIDELFTISGNVSYFRYVDDIILVGMPKDVALSIDMIEDRASSIGLALHPRSSPKSLELTCAQWLAAENDYDDGHERPSWKTLIGELKFFLAREPENRERLSKALADRGIRLPVTNYTRAVKEIPYLMRLRQWASSRWFRRSFNNASIDGICEQSSLLAARFLGEIKGIADAFPRLSRFGKKRAIPGLRYRLGRLPYISNESVLGQAIESVRDIEEVACNRAIAETVISGVVDEILDYGVNASQAVSQLMKSNDSIVTCRRPTLSSDASQSLCILALNGVRIDAASTVDRSVADLWAYATDGFSNVASQSSHNVVREATWLHGAGPLRHSETIATAFDIDDVVPFDAVSISATSAMS